MLARQKLGSAHGVPFITVEDETDVANLVIRPALFERKRRVMPGPRMPGADEQMHSRGEVPHGRAPALTTCRICWTEAGAGTAPTRSTGRDATLPARAKQKAV